MPNPKQALQDEIRIFRKTIAEAIMMVASSDGTGLILVSD